jgi:F420-0:gamma-glutamyl ligase
LMGESDESVPIVLIRGLSRRHLKKAEYDGRKFAISMDEDVYLRSLGYSPGA